ncbi:MAG: hypothetical protein V1921_06765 [Candidatus Altiarchaeota archaeon]
MVSLTLSVPLELKQKMDKFPEMNWSAVARRAIAEKITALDFMDRMLSKSELTEEDALTLGRKVNKAVAKRYLNVE